MNLGINNLDNNQLAFWETENVALGQILLDSILIPLGKVPELIVLESSAILFFSLTTQEIDEAVTTLIQTVHNMEVSSFIDCALSLMENPCAVKSDVAWSASGDFYWSLHN